ncbi:hypothetical protein C8J56DRAFT_958711, partial [Mycena floridula]
MELFVFCSFFHSMTYSLPRVILCSLCLDCRCPPFFLRIISLSFCFLCFLIFVGHISIHVSSSIYFIFSLFGPFI